MKKFYYISCLIIFMIISNLCFGQEDFSAVPSYKAELGKEVYHVTSHQIKYQSVLITIEDALMKMINTKVGTTGFIALGDMKIQYDTGDGLLHDFETGRLQMRFNPSELNDIIDLKKFELSNTTNTVGLYDFYIDSYSTMYHKGGELMIPPKNAIATFSIANDGNCYWISIRNGKLQINRQSYSDRVFKMMMNRGQTDKAIKELKWLCSINPEDPQALHLLGRAQSDVKDYENSVTTLEKLLLIPNNPNWMIAWTYAYLGKSRYYLGDKAKAKQALDKCIEMNATKNATNFAKNLLSEFKL